jgi:hypothetical protein
MASSNYLPSREEDLSAWAVNASTILTATPKAYVLAWNYQGRAQTADHTVSFPMSQVGMVAHISRPSGSRRAGCPGRSATSWPGPSRREGREE